MLNRIKKSFEKYGGRDGVKCPICGSEMEETYAGYVCPVCDYRKRA